jgi:Tfp pilus assembly protein PilV
VGTFNFSAKYLSKKDSSTMLPELTEFVPASRMAIARRHDTSLFMDDSETNITTVRKGKTKGLSEKQK